MKALNGSEVDLKPEGRAALGYTQKSGTGMPDSILVEARDLAKGDKIINLLDQNRWNGNLPPSNTQTLKIRSSGATDVYRSYSRHS